MPKSARLFGAAGASTSAAPSSVRKPALDVARLSSLSAEQLRLEWRNHLGGAAPAHLPRWLLTRVLAHRIQAREFGSLDRSTSRWLAASEGNRAPRAGSRPFAQRRALTREGAKLNGGALLAREWNGRVERVMALEEGFAWNGRTYRSLSQVAKAITGTNWNGHRFFGLRAATKGGKSPKADPGWPSGEEFP